MANDLKYTIEFDTLDAVKSINGALAELKKLGSVRIDDPTKSLQAALTATRDKAGRLRDELGRFVKDSPGTLRLDIAVNDAKAAAAVQQAITRLRQSTAGVRAIQVPVAPVMPAQGAAGSSALKNAFGAAGGVLGGFVAAVKGAVSSANAALQSYFSKARAVAQQNSGLSDSFKTLGAAAAAVVSVRALTGALTELYAAQSQVERTQARLKFVNGGDTKAAADDMAFLQAQVERIGLPLKAAEDGYSSLATAMREAGMTTTQTREVFLGVAEGARVMGLSADDTKGVFTALSQMASKGTISMEELRQQLGERLPVVMSVAAKSMGMTTEKFTELVEKGQITANEFLPRFGSAMRRTFEKDVATAANGLQANVNRMSNAWENLKRDVADDASGGMTEGVKRITEALKDDSVIEYAGKLGEALTKGIAASIDLFKWLGDLFRDAGYGARILAAGFEDVFGQPLRKLKVMAQQIMAEVKMALAQGLMSVYRSLSSLGFDSLAQKANQAAVSLAAGAAESLAGAKATAGAYDQAAASAKTQVELTRERIEAEKKAAAEKRTADKKAREDAAKKQQQDNQNYDKTPPKLKPGKGDKDKAKETAEQIAQAELAKANAEAEAAKKRAQADRAREEAQLDISLERRQISYAKFLADKAALEKKALDEQRAALKSEQAAAEAGIAVAKASGDKAKQLRFEGDLAKVKAELYALDQREVTIDAELKLKTEQGERDVEDLKVELRVSILELDGKSLDAALAQLKRETDNLLRDKRVKDDPELESEVRAQADRKETRLRYDDAKRQSELFSQQLALDVQKIEAQVEQGTLSELDAQRKVRDARQATADKMWEQVQAAEALAAKSGDPQLVLSAQQLRFEYEQLKGTLDVVAKSINETFFGSIKQGFQDLISGAKSFGDILKSIIADVLSKLAELALNQAIASMMKGAGGAGGGVGGFLSSLFGSLGAFAEGGHITGPGTGTSDSILARLSNGEFVIRAASVRALGLGTLQHINATGRLPAFATGGLAESFAGAFSPTVHNRVEPKVIVTTEAVRSALREDHGFERDIVDISVRNRRRINSGS